MKVLFFARLREALGSDSLAIDDGECPSDVAGLRALVLSRASGEFAEAFGDANVICAVNQRVVDDAHPLSARDEVAFFPPMTGG
jgi:molybdopterin synthase sulfur carrier subunit